MTSAATLLVDIDKRGVATLTLNRPDAFNAMSEDLLDALTAAIAALNQNEALRVVVIQANGKAFCAGHDLKEMRVCRGCS